MIIHKRMYISVVFQNCRHLAIQTHAGTVEDVQQMETSLRAHAQICMKGITARKVVFPFNMCLFMYLLGLFEVLSHVPMAIKQEKL